MAVTSGRCWPDETAVKVTGTELEGVFVVEPELHGDERGFFVEQFNAERYVAAGLPDIAPLQFNHSRSARGTLRGLHFQHPRGQDKLVWVASGCVFDVAVDVRRGSPTFGQWTGCELSADNHLQLFVPAGFAHGFVVTSEQADFMYACSDYYAPDCEHAVAYNDPSIGIRWPENLELTLSDRDRAAPLLVDADGLPDY